MSEPRIFTITTSGSYSRMIIRTFLKRRTLDSGEVLVEYLFTSLHASHKVMKGYDIVGCCNKRITKQLTQDQYSKFFHPEKCITMSVDGI